MTKALAYRVVCGLLGVFFALGGLVLFFAFFQYQVPDSPPMEPLPVGPNGVYFVAFAGCALVAWGGCLLGAARRPDAAPFIATATAVGLVLMALYRMIGWLIGDYAALGPLLRVEAAVFLVSALAMIWLRPRPAAAA